MQARRAADPQIGAGDGDAADAGDGPADGSGVGFEDGAGEGRGKDVGPGGGVAEGVDPGEESCGEGAALGEPLGDGEDVGAVVMAPVAPERGDAGLEERGAVSGGGGSAEIGTGRTHEPRTVTPGPVAW